LRFDPIHQLILAGTGSGKIHVIDVKAGLEIRCLDYHSKGIFDFTFSEKGDEVIALGGDGVLSCWTYPDFTPLRRIGISDSKCRQVAHVPHSDLIVIGTSGGEIVFLQP
jgi:WD40 repeat protein